MKYTFAKEKVLSSKRKNLTYFCGSNFKKKRKNYIFLKELLFSSKSIKNFILLHESDFKKKIIFYILQEIFLQGKFQKDFFIYILQGQFRSEKIFFRKKKIIYIFCKDNFKRTRNYFIQKEKNILYFSDRKTFFPKRKNLLYISKIKTIYMEEKSLLFRAAT